MTKRKRIAFVIDWIGSLYHAKLVEGVRRACRERGAELTIYMCGRLGSDLSVEKGSNLFFGLPEPDNCDGVIIGGAAQLYFAGMETVAEYLSRFGKKPVVTLGFEVTGYPSSFIDTAPAIGELTGHLVNQHQYRDFFCVTGAQTNGESSHRLFALQESLFALGIPLDPDSIYFGDFLYESGRGAGRVLSERKKLPQVIFCFSDTQACGVIDELSRKGISIPGDVAIIGFDNGEVGKIHNLTTIDLPFSEQAYRGAVHLLDRLEGTTTPLTPLPCRVVYRQSCGCGVAAKVDFTMERMNLADHFVADYDLEIINEMGIRLYASLEAPDMGSVLRQQLARLDVNEFYLGLFSDPADPLKETRGFAAVCNGKSNQRLLNKIIPRNELIKELRHYIGGEGDLVILSLFQGDAQMGILALKPENREIKLYELIRQQLSGVIKSRLFLEQIKNVNRQLEETNSRLRQVLAALAAEPGTDGKTAEDRMASLLSAAERDLYVNKTSGKEKGG